MQTRWKQLFMAHFATADKRYWYFDTTFVNCSCKRKLAHWASLIDNNRDYRFPDTQYLSPNVWELAYLTKHHRPTNYYQFISPWANGRHYKCIFINEKFCILSQISLKFVPNRIGDKPLSEPMLIQFIDACAALGGDGLIDYSLERSYMSIRVSPATRLFMKQLIQLVIETYIKTSHYWALVRGIHRSPVDSPHKGQWVMKSHSQKNWIGKKKHVFITPHHDGSAI